MEDVSILAMHTAKAASMAYLYAKGRDGVLIDAGLGCHELWEEAGRRGIRIHAVLFDLTLTTIISAGYRSFSLGQRGCRSTSTIVNETSCGILI